MPTPRYNSVTMDWSVRYPFFSVTCADRSEGNYAASIISNALRESDEKDKAVLQPIRQKLWDLRRLFYEIELFDRYIEILLRFPANFTRQLRREVKENFLAIPWNMAFMESYNPRHIRVRKLIEWLRSRIFCHRMYIRQVEDEVSDMYNNSHLQVYYPESDEYKMYIKAEPDLSHVKYMVNDNVNIRRFPQYMIVDDNNVMRRVGGPWRPGQRLLNQDIQ